MNEETRKILNRKLRDENIRIFLERNSSSIHQDQEPARKLNLTVEQIREKLKGGKYGKKEYR